MYNLKNKIIDKKKQLNNHYEDLNIDKTKHLIRILSPNIYKVFDKLISNEKFCFVNRGNENYIDNILVGDTKESINFFEVNKALNEMLESIEKNRKYRAYFCFGFLEWKDDNNFDNTYKLPVILFPINIQCVNGEYEVVGDLDFTNPFINPRLRLEIENKKGVKLPKYNFEEKIYSYLDKLSTLCEDNEITLIEEGCITSLNIYNEINYYNIEKKEKLITQNDLLVYLLNDKNNNNQIFEYLDDIDNETKFKIVFHFATKPFYKEEINSLVLSSLDYSFKVNVDETCEEEDLSNKTNFVSNILSSCISKNKKVLYIGSEENCRNIYNNFHDNPMQNLILSLDDQSVDHLKNDEFENHFYKKMYKLDRPNNFFEDFASNKHEIDKYNDFLKKDDLPLKLSVANVIEKYFELKLNYEEIYFNIDDILNTTMLDIHHYVHDINGFLKLFNGDSSIIENIWFGSNINDLSEKNITNISSRIDNLYTKGLEFYEKFKNISDIVSVEYETMADFYKFTKEVNSIEVGDDFKIVDYDYEELIKSIDEYNITRKEIFDAKRLTFESYGNEIYDVDIEDIVTRLDNNFDFLYKEIDYTVFDEDYIVNNIDDIIMVTREFSADIENCLNVCQKLFHYLEIKDNFSMNAYVKLADNLKPLYTGKVYDEKLFDTIQLNKNIELVSELIEIQNDILALDISLTKTFTKEFFLNDVNVFIDKFAYVSNAGATKLLSLKYKKDKEYLKSYLIYNDSINDTELIGEKIDEYLQLQKLKATFNEKIEVFNEFVFKKLKLNSNLEIERATLLELSNLIDYFKNNIPKKVFDVLTGNQHRDSAMTHTLKQISLGVSEKSKANIKNLLTDDSYIKLFNISLERFSLTFNDILTALISIKDDYDKINKYLVNSYKYLENINKLKAIIKIKVQEKESVEFYEKNLTPFKDFIQLNDNNLTKTKSEILVIENGKKLGLDIETIEKIFKIDKNMDFQKLYTPNIDTKFTAFTLEVKWLCNMLGVDVNISTFAQLKSLLERAKESFDIVKENKSLFEYLSTKTKVDITDILIAFNNNEVEKQDYINTFYLSFYKQWLLEVSKFNNFDFHMLNDILISLQESIIKNQKYNSKNIYNNYIEVLPLIDKNKRYYDEIGTFNDFDKNKLKIGQLFHEVPYLLQSFKPLVLTSFEKLIEMGVFKHIEFDTIIIDRYNDKNFSDAFAYFTKVRQLVIIENVNTKDEQSFDLSTKNFPEFTLNNICIDKRNKKAELLNVIKSKNHINCLGDTLAYSDVLFYNYEDENIKGTATNIFNVINKNDKSSVKNHIISLNEDIAKVLNELVLEQDDIKSLEVSDLSQNYILKNKKVFIVVNDTEDISKYSEMIDVNRFIEEISQSKEITLVLTKKYLDSEVEDNDFYKIINYLYKNSIINQYSTLKYLKKTLKVDNNSMKYIPDLYLDNLVYLDRLTSIHSKNIRYSYLWSNAFVVDDNYTKYLKSDYTIELDTDINTEEIELKNEYEERVFIKYREASVFDIEPSSDENQFIKNAVHHIVYTESPISLNILYQKVSLALSGILEQGQIEQKVNYILSFELTDSIEVVDGFCWVLDTINLKPRYRDFDTNIESVCHQEIEIAIIEILQKSLGITSECLFEYVLKELGFTNIKKEQIEYVVKIFNKLEKESIVRTIGNKVILGG